MTFNLIVVGAGPAGCSAAITAARAGATVLLLEKGKFPRHRVCGEFVSAESLDLLQNLLAPFHRKLISNAPRIAQGQIFVDGAVLRAKIDPAAASIARFDLDAALWDSCAQAGVITRDDRAVMTVEGTGPFAVATRDQTFEATAVINATGRWSNLSSPATRAQISNPKNDGRWVGLKAHFREGALSPTNHVASDSRAAGASVDLYFFDGGYCGVQPVGFENGSGTRINACAMVRADVATTFAEVVGCHTELQKRSRTWQPLMDPITTSPLVFHEPELESRGMLQAGDSATFVDPFVGDGISLALQSGSLVAECLLPLFRAECSFDQAAAEYRRAYKSRLAPVFRASSRLRQMLRWPAIIRKQALSLLQKTPSLTSQLVKMTR